MCTRQRRQKSSEARCLARVIRGRPVRLCAAAAERCDPDPEHATLGEIRPFALVGFLGFSRVFSGIKAEHPRYAAQVPRSIKLLRPALYRGFRPYATEHCGPDRMTGFRWRQLEVWIRVQCLAEFVTTGLFATGDANDERHIFVCGSLVRVRVQAEIQRGLELPRGRLVCAFLVALDRPFELLLAFGQWCFRYHKRPLCPLRHCCDGSSCILGWLRTLLNRCRRATGASQGDGSGHNPERLTSHGDYVHWNLCLIRTLASASSSTV